MKLSKHYKFSEYIFLFSILVLALLLGSYFSFYRFLWNDIKFDITEFSKKYQIESMKHMKMTADKDCCYTMDGSCVCGNVDCASTKGSCTP